MADEAQYSSGTDSAPNKRKYDDQTPTPTTRRVTGFSGPITPSSTDSAHAPPATYNNVPPPMDEIQIAKQRAQEIASRLIISSSGAAAGADAKRPRVENGSGGFDSYDKGFSSAPSDMKSHISNSAPSAIPVSYGFPGSSKKIEIPNGRVGVIIGKGGETIKYLQLQSGAKIQVTRDMDADPNSVTRLVELMGTPDQVAKAEQLITDVLSEAETGGSGTVSRRVTGQIGADQFVMKIPNNKVGLVIGKGGDTIKSMQARTGARIQVIPLHLPPGDTSTERTLQIDGSSEQIESAKQLVNEVISEFIYAKASVVLCFCLYPFTSNREKVSFCWSNTIIPSFSTNRARNPGMTGGYSHQGYQARPPTSWGPSGAPSMQQSGYGYGQPGSYSGPSPQYNMSQPPYQGYSQPSTGGYPSNWDQSSGGPPTQTTAQGSGYDYYGQQPPPQQQASGGPLAAGDNSGYNYNQTPGSTYSQHGYSQDGYGGYHAPPPQSGYGQPPYDQQQGYGSAPSYGNPQEGPTPTYGSQGDSAQSVPPVQPSGYGNNQQPNPTNLSSYPPQTTTQPGYGMAPAAQAGYGTQPPVQPGYGPGYGAQAQKPPANPPAYGQTAQSPSTPGSYGQPPQQGYPHSQPPPSGYAQPEAGSRAPPSTYGSAAVQAGYGPPAYGAQPASQTGYGQAPPPAYNNSYGGGYTHPAAYSTDGSAAAPAPQTSQQSGVAKASPKS